MSQPAQPGAQDTLSRAMTELPRIDTEYQQLKGRLQELSREWEQLLPQFVNLYETRRAWRRLEKQAMTEMQLPTDMLGASESEDEYVCHLVSQAKQVREDGKAEEWHNGDTTDEELAPDDEDEDDDNDDEAPDLSARLTKYELRIMKRFSQQPVMAQIPARMAEDRAFRLMRRREKLADPSSSSSSSSSSAPSSFGCAQRPKAAGSTNKPVPPEEKTKKLAAVRPTKAPRLR